MAGLRFGLTAGNRAKARRKTSRARASFERTARLWSVAAGDLLDRFAIEILGRQERFVIVGKIVESIANASANSAVSRRSAGAFRSRRASGRAGLCSQPAIPLRACRSCRFCLRKCSATCIRAMPHSQTQSVPFGVERTGRACGGQHRLLYHVGHVVRTRAEPARDATPDALGKRIIGARQASARPSCRPRITSRVRSSSMAGVHPSPLIG